MRFIKREIIAIIKAWIVISFAFAILMTAPFSLIGLLKNIPLAVITVGLGFLLHELAHKFVAQRYGCQAEFRAHNSMLVLAILTSFFGFVFAAPGAVYISGHTGISRTGKIALAGPLANILLAITFLPLTIIPKLASFANLGFIINSWFALFNLIPLFFFDGWKIVKWSRKFYFLLLAVAIGLMVLAF